MKFTIKEIFEEAQRVAAVHDMSFDEATNSCLSSIVAAVLGGVSTVIPKREWKERSGASREDFWETAQYDLGIPKDQHILLPEDM
jgi:hypothetical protein